MRFEQPVAPVESALEAYLRNVVEPAAAIATESIQAAIPGAQEIERKARQYRREGASQVEAVTRAYRESDLPPGVKGAIELGADPLNLIPGLGVVSVKTIPLAARAAAAGGRFAAKEMTVAAAQAAERAVPYAQKLRVGEAGFARIPGKPPARAVEVIIRDLRALGTQEGLDRATMNQVVKAVRNQDLLAMEELSPLPRPMQELVDRYVVAVQEGSAREARRIGKKIPSRPFSAIRTTKDDAIQAAREISPDEPLYVYQSPAGEFVATNDFDPALLDILKPDVLPPLKVARKARAKPAPVAEAPVEAIEVGDFIGSKMVKGDLREPLGFVEGEGVLGRNIPAWKVRLANGKITAIPKDDARFISRPLPETPTPTLEAEVARGQADMLPGQVPEAVAPTVARQAKLRLNTLADRRGLLTRADKVQLDQMALIDPSGTRNYAKWAAAEDWTDPIYKRRWQAISAYYEEEAKRLVSQAAAIPEAVVPAPVAKAVAPAAKEPSLYSEEALAAFRKGQVAVARQMSEAGASVRDIAKELKVPEPYAAELVKEAGIAPLAKPPGAAAPPPTVARVPVMITQRQRQVLLGRGLTEAQVDALTPQQAQDILAQAAPEVARPIVEAPGAVPKAVPLKVGDTVSHPQFGDLQVTDVSDPSLLGVRTATGAEIKIGRGAVTRMTPEVAPKAAEAVPPAMGGVTPSRGLERGFVTHTAESPMGSPILRELYDKEPITYSPITNAETLKRALEIVNADPVAARARLMIDIPIAPETMVDDLAQGFILMRKAANEGNVTELRDLSKRIAEKYTPIAQALQVASTLDKLSPEGLFVYTQRLITKAAEKGKGPAVARRLEVAARKVEVKEATANVMADIAEGEEKLTRASKNVSNVIEATAESRKGVARTLRGNQRAKDLQYLIDDTVREVQATLAPAERQAILKAKAILKQSVAEMDVATANSFLDRAAALNDLSGDVRVKALMDLVEEVRQLPQVQAGVTAGGVLKPAPKLLKQQAADLAQLIDRTRRNVFQQLNSVDRLAIARVKAILRRTDVELPQDMAEELLAEAHKLRGLPLTERAAALNKLTDKIKRFDPVEKELVRKKAIADAEARVRQAARQAANDLSALIDASSRKVPQGVTPADRLAIGQAKTILRRFGVELPRNMAEDFLARAKALNTLPDTEQAAGMRTLVNEIKVFNPVKQAQEDLALLRKRAAEAKQSAKDLQYLAHEELRVSKTRLKNVERDTIRSAKARLKVAGVEMQEELAQSFLDRAKALRGITDEYDQMRAAQSLLADVHSLVPPSKINTFFDIIGLPRIFQAAYDLSFSLRQGIIYFYGNTRRWGEMFKAGLKSMASEDAAVAADRQFFRRPLHKPAQEAGLEYIDRWGRVSQQEETFINSWTEKVPGVRQSNRAYVVQGNKIRGDVFDDKVVEWLPPEIREEVYWGKHRFETLDELVTATGKSRLDFERLAQWQNALTGRGDLGNFLKSNNQWLNGLFYAPRFAVSRVEVPIYAIRNFVQNPALRKMVAKDMASSIVGSTAALYMLSKLPGVEVEWNPLSSDFRKARIGPLRIDLDGGFNVLIRQIAQFSTGKRKVTATGEIQDVTRLDVLINNYLLNKLAPSPSLAKDILRGVDAVGNKLDTWEAMIWRVAQAWIPFVAQDTYEAMKEVGTVGMAVAPLSGFGATVAAHGLGVDWSKDFVDYYAIPTDPDEARAKNMVSRLEYREKNPEVDAKLFIIGQVDSLKTIRAKFRAVALMRENGIGLKDIRSLEEKRYESKDHAALRRFFEAQFPQPQKKKGIWAPWKKQRIWAPGEYRPGGLPPPIPTRTPW